MGLRRQKGYLWVILVNILYESSEKLLFAPYPTSPPLKLRGGRRGYLYNSNPLSACP
jgi:hypothetical protein